jgi:hypothetical protein
MNSNFDWGGLWLGGLLLTGGETSIKNSCSVLPYWYEHQLTSQLIKSLARSSFPGIDLHNPALCIDFLCVESWWNVRWITQAKSSVFWYGFTRSSLFRRCSLRTRVRASKFLAHSLAFTNLENYSIIGYVASLHLAGSRNIPHVHSQSRSEEYSL